MSNLNSEGLSVYNLKKGSVQLISICVKQQGWHEYQYQEVEECSYHQWTCNIIYVFMNV